MNKSESLPSSTLDTSSEIASIIEQQVRADQLVEIGVGDRIFDPRRMLPGMNLCIVFATHTGFDSKYVTGNSSKNVGIRRQLALACTKLRSEQNVPHFQVTADMFTCIDTRTGLLREDAQYKSGQVVADLPLNEGQNVARISSQSHGDSSLRPGCNVFYHQSLHDEYSGSKLSLARQPDTVEAVYIQASELMPEWRQVL